MQRGQDRLAESCGGKARRLPMGKSGQRRRAGVEGNRRGSSNRLYTTDTGLWPLETRRIPNGWNEVSVLKGDCVVHYGCSKTTFLVVRNAGFAPRSVPLGTPAEPKGKAGQNTRPEDARVRGSEHLHLTSRLMTESSSRVTDAHLLYRPYWARGRGVLPHIM
ncbi:hypothetical protein LZ30DRAFT_738733, partial [Colletotrichum cereale]